MREDMSRIIVERPRYGGRNRKGRVVAMEDLPCHEGMRRPHVRGYNPKMLNENLKPLWRYLERQVGRPWDKVYSEIARHLRVDSTVQQHVRDHLKDFVAVKPRRVAGGRFCSGNFGAEDNWIWHQALYVDPRDGLLKRTDRLPEVKARRRGSMRRWEPPSRVTLAADRELRRINGVWYEVMLAPLPQPAYRAVRDVQPIRLKGYRGPVVEMEVVIHRLVTPAVQDAVTGEAVLAGPEVDASWAWAAYHKAHPDRRYATRKRALSRPELRRHGLRNTPAEE